MSKFSITGDQGPAPEMASWQPDETADEHLRFGRGLVWGLLLTACLWGAGWLVWRAMG